MLMGPPNTHLFRRMMTPTKEFVKQSNNLVYKTLISVTVHTVSNVLDVVVVCLL